MGEALKHQVGGQHYKGLACQVVELAVMADLNSFQFNIIKYVMRYPEKNGIEDVKKALHYAQLAQELKPVNHANMKGLLAFCVLNKVEHNIAMMFYDVIEQNWDNVKQAIEELLDDLTIP